MEYYLSLGSNLGSIRKNLRTATRKLRAFGRVGPISPVYLTHPVGMAAGTPDFMNLVLRLESDTSPGILLKGLKKLEEEMGRLPSPGRTRSRPIDVDILISGNLIMESPELTIPHPRMLSRAFVIHPLADIAPHLVHPGTGQTISQIRRELRNAGAIKCLGPLDNLAAASE